MFRAALIVFLTLVVACIAPGQRAHTTSDKKKAEFVEYLKNLPTKGEFFTDNAVRKSKRYLPVLFSLTEDDVAQNDIFPYLALSRGLSEFKAQRSYAVTHFNEIKHPDFQLFWAVRLFDEGVASRKIKSYLLATLDDEIRAKVMKEMIGPDFEAFRRKLIKSSKK